MNDPGDEIDHAWARGEGRCHYCIDCDKYEWWTICDCWMAPDPYSKWHYFRLRWSNRLWKLFHRKGQLRL